MHRRKWSWRLNCLDYVVVILFEFFLVLVELIIRTIVGGSDNDQRSTMLCWVNRILNINLNIDIDFNIDFNINIKNITSTFTISIMLPSSMSIHHWHILVKMWWKSIIYIYFWWKSENQVQCWGDLWTCRWQACLQ